MRSFLTDLADETGGKVLAATRSDELRDTFVRIIQDFRSRYLLLYTPRGVDAAGWHPLQVTIRERRAVVSARKGYLR